LRNAKTRRAWQPFLPEVREFGGRSQPAELDRESS
jgi:hypothetical protein